MMDFGWAALYFLWFEVLSLPLRLVLARTRAPEDVRRFLSRVAGPVVLVLPIWYGGHVASFVTWHGFGLAWIGLALAGGAWHARRTGGLIRGLGYEWIGSGYQGTPRRAARQLAPEFIAFALFMGFIAFRRWVPEMTFEVGASAAEKFGNAMMFWSTWHGRGLPPEDYWLAGEPLTYYYWGHFHWSWLGRMGGFPAELALNLALARTTVLVFEGAWLLGRAMGLRAGWATVGAVAATWGGNPEALKQAWHVWSVPNVPYQWGGYDFWKPSRAIENVVDEFPAFSAILGDFHAHHLALPWFLGWLAILVAGPALGVEDRPFPPPGGNEKSDHVWHMDARLGRAWVGLRPEQPVEPPADRLRRGTLGGLVASRRLAAMCGGGAAGRGAGGRFDGLQSAVARRGVAAASGGREPGFLGKAAD